MVQQRYRSVSIVQILLRALSAPIVYRGFSRSLIETCPPESKHCLRYPKRRRIPMSTELYAMHNVFAHRK